MPTSLGTQWWIVVPPTETSTMPTYGAAPASLSNHCAIRRPMPQHTAEKSLTIVPLLSPAGVQFPLFGDVWGPSSERFPDTKLMRTRSPSASAAAYSSSLLSVPPTVSSMLDWPLQKNTSPKTTSVRKIASDVFVVDRMVRLYGPGLVGVVKSTDQLPQGAVSGVTQWFSPVFVGVTVNGPGNPLEPEMTTDSLVYASPKIRAGGSVGIPFCSTI
mmetsp:Transcript_9478/g.24444  ORF Transcript_9478/g.24444 Transcript_9478/m.24444 type:complete len:215 (-) Transcript_9478:198-842(-)